MGSAFLGILALGGLFLSLCALIRTRQFTAWTLRVPLRSVALNQLTKEVPLFPRIRGWQYLPSDPETYEAFVKDLTPPPASLVTWARVWAAGLALLWAGVLAYSYYSFF